MKVLWVKVELRYKLLTFALWLILEILQSVPLTDLTVIFVEKLMNSAINTVTLPRNSDYIY